MTVKSRYILIWHWKCQVAWEPVHAFLKLEWCAMLWGLSKWLAVIQRRNSIERNNLRKQRNKARTSFWSKDTQKDTELVHQDEWKEDRVHPLTDWPMSRYMHPRMNFSVLIISNIQTVPTKRTYADMSSPHYSCTTPCRWRSGGTWTQPLSMFLKVHTPVRECQDQWSYFGNKVRGPKMIT
jgi:hypothetical protein